MKRFTIVIAFALLASLLPGSAGASPAASPLPCSGRAVDVMRNGMEQIQLKTLDLEVSAAKETYRVGEVATFKALVTRPAKEDPLGQGIPMDRPFVTPAEDINLGVGLLFKGNVFLPGFGITDENGEVTLKVKIEKYVKPGMVNASFFAWKTVAELPCLRIDEAGHKPVPEIFRVVKTF